MHYLGYNERKQRGTIDFPVELYHLTSLHPQYHMSYHWHVEAELIRVLKGEFLLLVGGQEILMKEGDSIFVNGGTLHGGVPTDCVYDCIVFDMNMLLKQGDSSYPLIKGLSDGAGYFDYCNLSNITSIYTVLDLLFDALASKAEAYQLITLGSLYQLIGLLYKEKVLTTSTKVLEKDYKRVKLIKHILHVIESSYASPLTLTDLSKTAGMSPKYFCHFFYEMTHRTPIDYLNHYRIERACYELITTNNTITEIAYNCGFNDTSYFIKQFKKYKGITPKKYGITENTKVIEQD